MIEVKGIGKAFGGRRVLNSVSFDIPAGSCYGLVGENGCGKSTLLRIMAGVYSPDQGRILFDKVDITRYSSSPLLNLSPFNFQNTKSDTANYSPSASGLGTDRGFSVQETFDSAGAENSEVRGFLRGVRDSAKVANKRRELFFLPDDLHYSVNLNAVRLAEVYRAAYNFDERLFSMYIDIFKLDPKLSLRSYSKGMRRRLFLVFAFACRPRLLLLDEAFDGLDSVAKQIFIDQLTSMQNVDGCTTLVSSHALRELEDFCSKIIRI